MLKRTWMLGLATAMAVLLGGACGGGGSATVPGATAAGTTAASATASTPAATATQTAELPPEPLPQAVQDALDTVAKARNLEAPPALRAKIVTQEQVAGILHDALTADDLRWFEQTTTLYRLLGYLGPDESYLDIYEGFASGAVIGLYDPVANTLYVVTRGGRGFDELSPGEIETLAHELVHALQDYHFPLDVTAKEVQDDLDRNLAWLAAVEGDAVTHEGAAMRRGALPAGRMYVLGDLTRAVALATPAAIERELRFPYTTGANWIAGLKAAGGTAAIDDVVADPPATTAVVLHPERGVRWQPERPAAIDLTATLGAGWNHESGGSFGEFHWGNFLQTRLPGLDATEAATAWRGDRYDVYARAGGSAVVFLVNADPGLLAGLRAMLTQQTESSAETDGALRAKMRDGRQFILTPSGEGFSLVAGSSTSIADEVAAALSRG
ncbi:MAG: hypothetical protein H6676_02810 [Thermoflexaceae bacterium]|nr:hypothetical protein [Thermoflexaceae bacterium]